MSSRLVLTLATGQAGKQMLAISGPIMQRYAARVGAQFRVIDDPAISPGYALGAKFQAGQYLRAGWGRLLFLDADVVLAPDCPDLFALVPETHLGLYDDTADCERDAASWGGSTAWLAKLRTDLCASQGWADPGGPATCWNSGVVVASRAHATYYDAPAKPYPTYNHCAEQTLCELNARRAGLPVHFLPRDLNYQWWADRGGFDAARPAVKHFSGMATSDGFGPGPAARLAALRSCAESLYPAVPQCRYRSDLPVQYAGGCCGDTQERIAGAHEYDCERFDAHCCGGLPLSELTVRRCRACPDWASEGAATAAAGAPGP